MNVRIGNNSPMILGATSRDEIQTYSRLGRILAKANQESGLTIGIVIFNVYTCPVVLNVSYILICVNRYDYEMVCICYDM